MTQAFAPGLGATLFAGIVVPACVALGAWQLDRAEQKRELAQTRAERARLPPLRLTDPVVRVLGSDTLRDRRVEMWGRYEAAPVFFLDNQTNAGAPGYGVLSVFAISGVGARVLVQRGWAASGFDRGVLPDITTPEDMVGIAGVVRTPQRVGHEFVRGDLETIGAGHYRMVSVNLDAIAAVLGQPLAQAVIELDAKAAGALVPLPRVQTRFEPERHEAYALQWFAIAGACGVVYLVHGFRAARCEFAS